MKGVLRLAVFLLLSSAILASPADSIVCHVLDSGFIYETAPFPSCHASTLVETPDGFLAAWFGGTQERHPDVCIYTAILKEGKWTAPVLAADGVAGDDLRFPCWNPVLFRKDNGAVILFYKVGPSPREWWGMYSISADNGRCWSPGEKIPGTLLGPVKNKPLRLEDGTLLHPSSTETQKAWRIHLETSDQDLSRWDKIPIDNRKYQAIQPTLLTYPGGRLQLLCRSREKRILESWSDDQGKTWKPLQVTPLPNNNSGIDGVSLRNGWQLLVCNPLEEGRHKLAVLASRNGINWVTVAVLEDHKTGEYSYPAVIQGKDGRIYITYTWQRKKIKFVCLEVTGH